MVPVPPDFFWSKRDARSICYFVAEDEVSGEILGTVTGVDHFRAFNDPERGGSLWCLAVDPQARHPGVGQALVRHLAEYFAARGLAYLDLSVMHDNDQAIALYEKLGFHRVPYFTVKRKNLINETLYTGPDVDDALNLTPRSSCARHAAGASGSRSPMPNTASSRCPRAVARSAAAKASAN